MLQSQDRAREQTVPDQKDRHEEVGEKSQVPAEGAEPPSWAENRQLRPRFAVDFDLTLDSEQYFYAGSATNLSIGGFFVATHILQNIGEKFRFTLRLHDVAKLIKGVGEVRWHRPKEESPDAPAGMGIRFVELEAGAAETIESFLADRKPLRWDSG
jgi:uncharacterized protein (TIGR02266 family)